MSAETTFSQLDAGCGGTAKNSALGGWYDSVKDRSVAALTVDDLCRAVRQDVHLEHVVPVALEAIESDPLAGQQYDGELASVLARIPLPFWNAHPTLVNQMAHLMRGFYSLYDKDVQKELDAIIGVADTLGSGGHRDSSEVGRP
jgi:hypothetical protein